MELSGTCRRPRRTSCNGSCCTQTSEPKRPRRRNRRSNTLPAHTTWLDIVPIQSYIWVSMLSFSRKTDYALIALSHLARLQGRTVSAREIAQAYGLPQALVMNVLKAMHRAGIVSSVRGVKGG